MSKPTCHWYFVGMQHVTHADQWHASCKKSAFKTALPANSFSYCPYCGKWLALHESMPRPASEKGAGR